MTPRRQRMLAVGLVFAGVVIAVVLAINAFDDNIAYFYSPSEVLEGQAPEGKRIRLGGLVESGSVTREPGELEVRFNVTDGQQTIVVAYAGVLPDLFREGQGVIVFGVTETEAGNSTLLRADEVLAKHDENYMPPEVAEMLKEKGHSLDDPGGESGQQYQHSAGE